VSSGLGLCAPLLVVRTSQTACVQKRTDSDFCNEAPGPNDCEQDNDCTTLDQRACINHEGSCNCRPTFCTIDNDCGDGYACLCSFESDELVNAEPQADPLFFLNNNSCILAECRTSADCEGAPCVLSKRTSQGVRRTPFLGFFCLNGGCIGDADCGSNSYKWENTFEFCGYDISQELWTCQKGDNTGG
jgi:hypothetical protein